VSVCIPCYNGEKFIGSTVESILNQTLVDFEIIIVDDASSDRTVAVAQAYRDKRIRLIRNPLNLGMGGNWNKAVSHSRGKYV
jgi:glycosyltransferase involved in cell wall biosynthesis